MKRSSTFNISCPRAALPAMLILSTLTACAMNDLPRNMYLKAFNPHRADFTCAHEANKLPPITNESEMLFQQGMVVTGNELWPSQRDYKQAAQLWEKAATLDHWKAAMNLAGLYERGLGVQRDTERAVLIVEGLMKQGVPNAFDKMGTYHQSGIGVKPDIDRAYGFWQLAADMGSPAAQTYLGEKLDAAYDSPGEGFWGNSAVGIKMMECAFAQGYGEAGYRLGQTLNLDGKNYARALVVLHESVKFGSKSAAGYLSSSFRHQDPLTDNSIDLARADRYSSLYEALELNPDLRFPNLDKVLPLPPAPLAFWDGKRETLINAAKAVVVKRPAPVTPGASRAAGAHIPQAYGAVSRYHKGSPVPQALQIHPDVAQGIARYVPAPQVATSCNGTVPCPRTGIWSARLNKAHENYRVFHDRWQQAYIERGRPFPVPSALYQAGGITAGARDIRWHWLGDANQMDTSGHVHVTLTQIVG